MNVPRNHHQARGVAWKKVESEKSEYLEIRIQAQQVTDL